MEMDQLTSEANVLQSTKNILNNSWEALKTDIVRFSFYLSESNIIDF
jgi:hypothetical protein